MAAEGFLNLPWSSTPPKSQLAEYWDIRRAPAKGDIRGFILSDQVTGLPTHFWGGRTRPCSGELCEACRANNAATWKGYVAVTDDTFTAKWLFELNARVADFLRKKRSELRTLRGSRLMLRRNNGRMNGTIICGFEASCIAASMLPDAPNVEQKLCRIWEVHYNPAPRPLIQDKPRLADGTGT